MDLSQLAGAATQQEVIDRVSLEKQALLRKNSDRRPKLIIRVALDLTTARDSTNPYHVSDAFTGYYVETVSTSTATVSIGLISNEDVNLKFNYINVTQKDKLNSNEPLRGAYLTWLAQSGVTMTIVFFVGVEFTPGSYLTQITGGIFDSYGVLMSPAAPVTVTASATAIDTAQANAKRRTLQVLTGAGVYFSGKNTLTGGSGGFPGIFVGVGGTYEWQNPGPIFGITDGGSSIVSMNTEA